MKIIAAALAGLSLLCVALRAAERPNVVLILADDLGYADISSYGSKVSRTPNIDRLASQGVRLTQFYANAPECSPTRTALLTGRYQQRAGGLECAIGVGGAGRNDDARRLAAQGELGLPPRMTVLPSALKPAGYRSALIGKWHLGYEPKFHPLEHGFDFFVGITGGNADYFHHVESNDDPTKPGEHVLMRNRESYRDSRYFTHLVTEEAVDWIKQQRAGQPFFAYIPYTAPHTPLQGPNDRRERPLIGREFTQTYPDRYRQLVEEMDKGIGAILAALDEMNLAKDTIVIFTSDNGATRAGETQPFQGTKGQLLEGGIRVPCVIRWPGRIAPATINTQVAIMMDLTRSIVELAGASDRAKALDGMDIIGHLAANKPDVPRTLYWRYWRMAVKRKAVREGFLKLIEDQEGEKRTVRLFDLSSDLGETRDLSAQYPDTVARLRAQIAAWETEVRPVR